MIRLHIEPHFEGITAAACTEEDYPPVGAVAGGRRAGARRGRDLAPAPGFAEEHREPTRAALLRVPATHRGRSADPVIEPLRPNAPCPRTDDEIDDEMVRSWSTRSTSASAPNWPPSSTGTSWTSRTSSLGQACAGAS
ncbi:hypothetical protein ACU686_40275 [Yinghuangia aomiensis]